MLRSQSYTKILCPAKVNLILRVGPKRRDGYHEVETLMVPVSFGDLLSISVKPARTTKIVLNCPGLKVPPQKNLVYRAAQIFSEKFGIQFEAKVHLKKVVPTGAGLGGGSSNAAQVLKWLAKWAFETPTPSQKRKLHKMAASLGADVPFFLDESAAWCTGLGEKIKAVRLKTLAVVIVLPRTKVPTPWAYRELDNYRERLVMADFLKGFPHWIKEPFQVPELENHFEEPVTLLKPALKGIKTEIARSGALAALMSGSGSAFFGVYRDKKEAQKAEKYLRRRGLKAVATQTL